MSQRGASNWRDDAASQNMFLNILVIHHNSTATTEHGSDFLQSGERCDFFVSRMDAVVAPIS
jgi:hypothetical protein